MSVTVSTQPSTVSVRKHLVERYPEAIPTCRLQQGLSSTSGSRPWTMDSGGLSTVSFHDGDRDRYQATDSEQSRSIIGKILTILSTVGLETAH